jgi:hypothetical protein
VNSARPWHSIRDELAVLPELEDAGVTLAYGWVAQLATPAIIVAPVRRELVQPCDVRWHLALQVIAPLQSDDDEVVHALLELALEHLPSGVIVGETTYAQDDRAGASYLVSTTELTA